MVASVGRGASVLNEGGVYYGAGAGQQVTNLIHSWHFFKRRTSFKKYIQDAYLLK